MEIAGISYLKFVLALAFVLALILLLSAAAKRFGFGNRGPVKRGAGKRLDIVESLPIDAKRRLLLVRRDAEEHLIMIGANGEQVLETGITPPPAADNGPAPVTALRLPASGRS